MGSLKKVLMLMGLTATSICGLVGFTTQSKNSSEVCADAPSTTYEVTTAAEYFKNFDDSTSGDTLLSSLRTFNMSKRKSNYDYSSLNGIFKYTDYDPNTVKYDSKGQAYGTSLLSFYSGISTTSYNKEHVWPNSRGGGSDKGKSGSPYVEDDVYMPRPTISAENSNRGNSAYVEGLCDQSKGWDPVTAFADNIGVYDSIRGECARIIFYCMTVNSKLKLVDDANTDFAGTGGRVTMGKLSDMLKWHLTNPVNEREINRNKGGQYLQGNRNAFVDRRSYACKIWGNTNATTKSYCDQYNGWTDDPEPTKTLTDLNFTGAPAKTNYLVGESFDPSGLTVTATFDDASTLDVTDSVTWSTLTLGDTSVTGSYTYSNVTKTITVSGITVKAPHINVESVDAFIIGGDHYINDKINISWTVLPENASNKNVTFDSSNNTVASVSSSGVITCKTLGKATITVTSEDNPSAIKTLEVNVVNEPAVPVTSIEIEPLTETYYPGDTAQLTWVVNPDDATNPNVQFVSSNQDVATITNAGFVTCLTSGTSRLSVYAQDGSGVSAYVDLTVNKVEPIHVTSVTISPKEATIAKGETLQLSPIVLPENATDKSVTWTSSDTQIIKVDSKGKVTAIGEGDAFVAVKTNDGDYIDYCNIAVTKGDTRELVEIKVTKNPIRNIYSVGEELDFSGIEVEAHYLDGTKEIVSDDVEIKEVSTAQAGIFDVEVSYKTRKTTFKIQVTDEKLNNLKIEKRPQKTNYFASETFNPFGIEVVGIFGEDGTNLDVTSLVKYEYDFATSNLVKIKLQSCSTTITITLEEGEITNEHKAADFVYAFNENIGDVKQENVTLKTWKILEYNFNTLSSEVKQILKKTVTTYSKGEVAAEDDLTQKFKACVTSYDEIYLAHKNDGFNDFMSRNPVSPSTPSSSGIDPVILVSIIGGAIVLVALIVVIIVLASKKGKKKYE